MGLCFDFLSVFEGDENADDAQKPFGLKIEAEALTEKDHLLPDNFLGPVHDTVHSSDPFPLGLALQILGYTLCGVHLLDDQATAFLCLFVQVGKIGVQFARQNQMVEK